MLDEEQKELGKAEVEFALVALRGVVFANGGAAVALLALLVAVLDKLPAKAPVLLAGLLPGLIWFVAGVWAGITSSGLAYLAQLQFSNWRKNRARLLRQIAMGLVVVGLLSFALGTGFTAYAFKLAFLPA